MANLKRLDEIAKANNNNRAFGLSGYAASVDFIKSQISSSTLFDYRIQDFPALFAQVESIAFSVDDTSYYVYGLTYSPSTTPEGVTAELVLGPSGPEGCTVEGYEGYDASIPRMLGLDFMKANE